MSTRVCIWGAWYESKNLGDQAILMTIATLLAARLKRVELTVISNQPVWTESYVRSLGLENVRVRAISQRRQMPELVRALRQADLFLVGGGTPIYDDTFHLAAMWFLVTIALLGGARVMTYAISARPIGNPLNRRMCRHILRRIPLLTAREAQSVRILEDLVGDSSRSIQLYTDPVVACQLPTKPLPPGLADIVQLGLEDGRDLVAVCPHFFSAGHGYRVHHYARFRPEVIANYYDSLAQLCDRLTDRAVPLLLPMNAEDPDNDIAAIIAIRQRMKQKDRTAAYLGQLRPAEVLAVLRSCRLVIGARLHSLVFASVVHAPMIAISYGPKVAGFMQTLGLDRYVHHLDGLDAEALWATVEEVWNRCEQVRDHLSHRALELKTLANANADAAIALLSGSTSQRGHLEVDS